mgnify:CR=1 FL=1
MLEIFRNKKKFSSIERPVHNHIDTSNNTYESKFQSNSSDIKIARLMELIGYAIEEWAVEYHLENLPKKILFEQALDAMRAIEISMDNAKF